MQRSTYLKICNQITLLEKQMFQARQKRLENYEEYKSLLDQYVKLSKEIIRGKEEDNSNNFLLDDEDRV